MQTEFEKGVQAAGVVGRCDAVGSPGLVGEYPGLVGEYPGLVGE